MLSLYQAEALVCRMKMEMSRMYDEAHKVDLGNPGAPQSKLDSSSRCVSS